MLFLSVVEEVVRTKPEALSRLHESFAPSYILLGKDMSVCFERPLELCRMTKWHAACCLNSSLTSQTLGSGDTGTLFVVCFWNVNCPIMLQQSCDLHNYDHCNMIGQFKFE